MKATMAMECCIAREEVIDVAKDHRVSSKRKDEKKILLVRQSLPGGAKGATGMLQKPQIGEEPAIM